MTGRHCVALLAGLVVWAGALAAECSQSSAAKPCPVNLDCSHPGPPCYEDEPCWSWPKMGNHRRGVILESGRHRVIGACAYQRLFYGGRIDRTRTDRLPGDGWARRFGCGFDVLDY